MIVSTKPQMYQLLSAGKFGNTVPQWFSLEEWQNDPGSQLPLWGIRSGKAGGDKRMRLNVPRDQVADLYQEWFPSGGGNISPMIDMFAVLRAEVVEADFAPCGLHITYVPPDSPIDPLDPWRGSFRNYATHAHGLKALILLKQFLWPNDLEDLRTTLDSYPGHVVELSACSRAVGVCPNRNTIIWEVRKY